MATYYVKVGGNDTLNGLSWGNAWATVNKAATTATANDLIIYGNGIYDLGTGQATWNSGSIGNFITHRAFNRHLACWEQGGAGSTVDMDTDSYVTFQELLVRGDGVNEQTAIFRLYECDHIVLDDCDIGASALAMWGVRIRAGVGMRIIDCTIHPENGETELDGQDGIVVFGASSDIEIVDTEVCYTDHVGIKIATGNGVLIDNCHVHHTGSHGLGIGDTADSGFTLDDIMVRDCRIHDQDTTYDHAGGWHNNIRVHLHVSNLTLLRNDLYNAAMSGINITCEAVGPIYIYNNTLWNQGLSQPHVAIWFDENHLPDQIANNIYYKNNIVFVTQDGFRAFQADPTFEEWIEADHNLYYSSGDTSEIRRNGTTYTSFADYKTAGYEANAVIDDDPDFKDVGNANFAIWRWSPAVNEGVDIGESFYGPAPDIGAHEHRRPAIVGAWT